MVTKILQRLASKEMFTEDKESYMCDFNVILRSYAGRFKRFSKLLTVSWFRATERKLICVQDASTELPKFSFPNSSDDKESISFFENMIKKYLPQIKEKLQGEEDILTFLEENFAEKTSAPHVTLDPDNVNKSENNQTTKSGLFDKARKRMFRKSQVLQFRASADIPVSIDSSEVPSGNNSGQLVVLKELLREESRSRQQMEADLHAAWLVLCCLAFFTHTVTTVID